MKNSLPEILFYFSEKINQLKGLGVKDIILDPDLVLEKHWNKIMH